MAWSQQAINGQALGRVGRSAAQAHRHPRGYMVKVPYRTLKIISTQDASNFPTSTCTSSASLRRPRSSGVECFHCPFHPSSERDLLSTALVPCSSLDREKRNCLLPAPSHAPGFTQNPTIRTNQSTTALNRRPSPNCLIEAPSR